MVSVPEASHPIPSQTRGEALALDLQGAASPASHDSCDCRQLLPWLAGWPNGHELLNHCRILALPSYPSAHLSSYRDLQPVQDITPWICLSSDISYHNSTVLNAPSRESATVVLVQLLADDPIGSPNFPLSCLQPLPQRVSESWQCPSRSLPVIRSGLVVHYRQKSMIG